MMPLIQQQYVAWALIVVVIVLVVLIVNLTLNLLAERRIKK